MPIPSRTQETLYECTTTELCLNYVWSRGSANNIKAEISVLSVSLSPLLLQSKSPVSTAYATSAVHIFVQAAMPLTKKKARKTTARSLTPESVHLSDGEVMESVQPELQQPKSQSQGTESHSQESKSLSKSLRSKRRKRSLWSLFLHRKMTWWNNIKATLVSSTRHLLTTKTLSTRIVCGMSMVTSFKWRQHCWKPGLKVWEPGLSSWPKSVWWWCGPKQTEGQVDHRLF